MPIDEACSATQQTGVFQQPASFSLIFLNRSSPKHVSACLHHWKQDASSSKTTKPHCPHVILASLEKISKTAPHSGQSFRFKVGVRILDAPGHFAFIPAQPFVFKSWLHDITAGAHDKQIKMDIFMNNVILLVVQ
jgi:hypothetical protein